MIDSILGADNTLQSIIQMNPFDAVTVLEQHSEHKYSIVKANERAQQLFGLQEHSSKEVTSFFSNDIWQQLNSFLIEQVNNPYYLSKSGQQLAVHIEQIELSQHKYVAIIFRKIDSEQSQTLRGHLEASRHLYFVEQYVDPVISVDLKGDIIYTNIAAAKKLIKSSVSILGESIFSIVDYHYKDELKQLFENTIAGHPLGMPECFLR
ncbi:MAG: hypothetical protein ABS882_11480, partial [Lysinibacillus sp.]